MTADGIEFVGDDAMRFPVETLSMRASIAEQLRQTEDWLEVVPGRVDLCVLFDPLRMTPEEARARLGQSIAQLSTTASSRLIEPVTLDVVFSAETGPELESCAAENGLSVADFVAKLAKSALMVDLIGFTPGFAYVGGVDPDLSAERLDQPRAHVDAGAIGFISGSLGLYALAGPAGWPIIGRVKTPLFDAQADPPILLQMGQPISLRILSDDR